MVRWVGFWWVLQNLWVSLVATFLARDWNLHIINSHVAGAIGWSFMRLDAAWHEWILVALAVVIDGMLAVSAQCGCCHHFLPYFSIMPYQVCFLTLHFFYWSASCLLYVLWISSSYFTYNITWVALCILFPFSFCYYMVYILWGLWVLLGGGSYSAVYVPPPLCLFPVVLIMYIPPSFFCHVLYAYFFFHICP